MRKIIIVLVAIFTLGLNQAYSQLTVTIGKAENVNPNTNVTIDVTATGFTSLLGVQFSINYDSLVLDYVNATNFNTTISLNASAISGPNGVGVKNGQITFSWFDNGGNGISLPAGTRLFSIVFAAKGADCSSTDIVTSSIPRVIEITNSSLANVPLINVMGSVKMRCGPSGGGDPCPDPACTNANALTITGAKVTAASGADVCVPFTVRNFNNIQSGQGTFSWNPSELQFTRRILPFPGSLDTTGFVFNSQNLANGVLGFLWSNPNPAAGVTLPNDTKLIDLCFKVLAPAPDTVCVLFGQNTTVPVDWGNNQGEVPVCIKYGKVFIGTVGPQDAVGIIVGNAVGKEGETVCVDVTVNNFEDILSLETEFKYDAAKLQFVRTDMYMLDGLNATSHFNSTSGSLKLSWSNTNPVDRPDGAKIFQICFKILGPCPGSAPITFGATEVTALVGGQAAEIPNTTTPGMVQCTTMVMDQPVITCTPGTVTNVTCNNLTNGTANLTITGTLLNECEIQWTTNPGGIIVRAYSLLSNGTNLTNVGAGNYTYTVRWTKDNSVILCTGSMIINQPQPINIPTANVVTNVTCGQKGAIDLRLTSGGTPNYTYNWNPNLGNTNNPVNLDAGTYAVTVTDANSCTATASFTITESSTALSASATATNVKCNGGSDGTIVVTANGGCAPYTFAPAVLTGLKAGSYVITVTDSKGATTTTSTTITEPAPLVIASPVITNATLPNNNNGAISITISGGTPLYSVAWTSPLAGGSTSGTFNTTNVVPGTYAATVTDANGCTATVSNVIVIGGTDPGSAPTIGSISASNANNGFSVKCFGESNGSITVNFSGTLPIRAQLKNGNANVGGEQTITTGTSYTFNNLVASNNYTVVLTNSVGTVTSQAVTVTQPSKLAPSASATCTEIGKSTGSAVVNANATGVSPYTYLWSDNSTTNSISNLARGVYNVTVTDANGCTSSITNVEVTNCGQTGECYEATKIITPNGDNFNDLFIINCVNESPNDLVIFDRYGKSVFSQLDYDNTWSGVDRAGKDLDEGVYFWVLTNRVSQGKRDIYKGSITILRSR